MRKFAAVRFVALGSTAVVAIAFFGAPSLSAGRTPSTHLAIASTSHRSGLASVNSTVNGADIISSVVPGTVTVTAHVSPIAGGGELYTYDLPDGEVDSVPVPPITFNPVTATASQLAAYGFPAEPTSAANQASWTAAMSAYKSEPAPPLNLYVSPGTLSSNSGAAAPVYDGAWSGYWAGTPGGGTKYTGVSAVFNTPDITSPSNGTCNDPAGNSTSMATWVGLGGNSSNLVQEGVMWCSSVLDPAGTPEWQPFTEFVLLDGSKWNPTSVCGNPAWTVGFDNTMFLNLNYSTSSGEANFFVEDESTGVVHSCWAIPPGSGSWTFDGNTADFINEQVVPSDNDLPQYDAFLFGSDQAVLATGGTVDLGNMAGIRNAYTGCALDISQYAGGIHSDETDFSQYWSAYNYPLCL